MPISTPSVLCDNASLSSVTISVVIKLIARHPLLTRPTAYTARRRTREQVAYGWEFYREVGKHLHTAHGSCASLFDYSLWWKSLQAKSLGRKYRYIDIDERIEMMWEVKYWWNVYGNMRVTGRYLASLDDFRGKITDSPFPFIYVECGAILHNITVHLKPNSLHDMVHGFPWKKIGFFVLYFKYNFLSV